MCYIVPTIASIASIAVTGNNWSFIDIITIYRRRRRDNNYRPFLFSIYRREKKPKTRRCTMYENAENGIPCGGGGVRVILIRPVHDVVCSCRSRGDTRGDRSFSWIISDRFVRENTLGQHDDGPNDTSRGRRSRQTRRYVLNVPNTRRSERNDRENDNHNCDRSRKFVDVVLTVSKLSVFVGRVEKRCASWTRN